MHLGAFGTLILQMSAILLTSRALGLLARRLGQPQVIAEMLAGIALGPSILGWLSPATMAWLFPVTSLPVLKAVSQLGLLLFMFLVGLEFDPRLLRGRAHASVAISHTSILFPFALGAGAAWFLQQGYKPAGVSLTAFMLFTGVSMSVTAFPVLARILSERHLTATRVGSIATACAAVDDVTAWCLLAFVVSVATATTSTAALLTTALAIGFILFMLLAVRPFLGRLAERVASPEGLTPGILAGSLLLLLASSLTTEAIGVHALFGAFLFGAALPKTGRLAESLVERVETVAVTLLLPLFFAYSGLRTHIELLGGARDWMVAGWILFLATAGKFGGSAIAARLTGLRWREAGAIGVLMNTRGLMELVVLNIGMDIGVISPSLFAMLVLMALTTTIATAPLISVLYPDEQLARDRDEEAGVPRAPEAPRFGALVCVSDARAAPGLVSVATSLLGSSDAPLLGLHLWKPADRPSEERRRVEPGGEDGPLGVLVREAKQRSIPVNPLAFASSDPARDICHTAEAKGASLILLGGHRALLFEGALGGVVGDVVACARVPVGVLVDRGLARVRRVLVAFAGSQTDRAALQVARRLGEQGSASLTLLHVVRPEEGTDRGLGRRQVAEVFEDQKDAVELRIVEHASPSTAVLEEAPRGYDLLVVGMNPAVGAGLGSIGSRRRRVLEECPISVLAVHSPVAVEMVLPSAALVPARS